MKNNLVRLCCLFTAISAVVLVTGCALPQRGAFSGTRIDFNAYPGARVGMLPIAINPQYDATALPVAEIRDAVSRALGSSLNLHPLEIQPSDVPAGAGTFPLTPQRLSTLAEQQGWDGILGISVASWSAETPRDARRSMAHVDLMISYADRRNPRGQWTVTGTWSASSAPRLPEKIAIGLPLTLMDMRLGLATRSPRALFMKRQADRPQLTYIAPDADTLALAPQKETTRKYIDLHLTSIDDAGLLGMEATNDRAEFRWKLEGAKNDKDEYPIFLAAKLRVPLAHAENKIVLTSRSADAARTQARREFSITSSAHHELVAIAIGVDAYEHLGTVHGAAAGAQELAAAARSQSTAPFGGLTDREATLHAIDSLLGKAAQHESVGDTVLVSFGGRAVPLGSAVFLALPDVEPGTPSGSFLRVEDLIRSGSSKEMILVLDLCAESGEWARVRRYLHAAIPAGQRALVRLGQCAVPLGGLASAAAKVLEQKDRLSTDRYRGKQFFADFLRLLQSGQLAGPAGAVWTDTIFPGDGSLPTGVTTNWVRYLKEPGFWGSWLGAGPTEAMKSRPSIEPSEFYVITYSASTEEDAVREARKWGRAASVIEGTSGFFGVAIGQAKDARSAYEKLQRAIDNGEVSSDAYVLPRSRIKRVIP